MAADEAMIYINGNFFPEHEAKVSVFDHGFLYGDGIYETLRTYNGNLFCFEEHYNRLRRSAEIIGLNLKISCIELLAAVEQTILKNQLTEARVRITISRGEGPIGLDPDLCKEPTVVIIASEFKPYGPEVYEKGIKLIVAKTIRNHKQAINPEAKTLNFLNNILATIEAKKAGAFDALMLNYEGYVAEATIANVFMVKEGVLYTPAFEVGLLNGITRQLVIDCAKALKVEVHESKFTQEELLAADEVFLTNTSGEVIPVSCVNTTIYNVGPLTKRLCVELLTLCH